MAALPQPGDKLPVLGHLRADRHVPDDALAGLLGKRRQVRSGKTAVIRRG